MDLYTLSFTYLSNSLYCKLIIGVLNLLSDIISSLLENTEGKNQLTNTYFNTQILASRNRNSTFHSFGMWRGGGVYCRLTRQWLYLHRWFLKKYFLQIHFSYFFAFFFLLLGIAKISDTMI